MKKIFVWLLITIGKMLVALAVKMNIFGIKPLTNYMVLALVPVQVLAQHQRSLLLRAVLLKAAALPLLLARKPAQNNIRYSTTVSEDAY